MQHAVGFSFSGTTVSATFPGAVIVGNAILVGWVIDAALSANGIADGTNTYSVGASNTGAGNPAKAGFGFSLNIGAGTPTVTLTASGTIGNATIWIEEWSGIATGSAADGSHALFTSGAGTPGEAFNAGSFTPGTSGDLIWAFGHCGNGGAVTPGSGFSTAVNDSADAFQSQFLTQSVAAAINAGFHSTPGGFAYYGVAAAFKAAGGGGGSPLRRNSSLDGLGASGPFFSNPLARRMLGWRKGLFIPVFA